MDRFILVKFKMNKDMAKEFIITKTAKSMLDNGN